MRVIYLFYSVVMKSFLDIYIYFHTTGNVYLTALALLYTPSLSEKYKEENISSITVGKVWLLCWLFSKNTDYDSLDAVPMLRPVETS